MTHSAAAQSALCQLSVFPTSFDLTAVQAVVAIPGVVEELLELLRRRSLLEWDAVLERYSQHDLLRVFAASCLEDGEAVRLRHAQHYAAVAQQADDLYIKGGAALLAGLALFDREHSQIEAGWGWAVTGAGSASGDPLLISYTEATVYISALRFHQRDEYIPRLEAALEAARRLEQSAGWLLGNLGLAYADLGDARKAIEFHEQALAISREIGDRRGEGSSLGNLGLAYALCANMS